jgi:hypothetical protein
MASSGTSQNLPRPACPAPLIPLIGPPVIRIWPKPFIFSANYKSNRHKMHPIPPEVHRPAGQFLIENRTIRNLPQVTHNKRLSIFLIENFRPVLPLSGLPASPSL